MCDIITSTRFVLFNLVFGRGLQTIVPQFGCSLVLRYFAAFQFDTSMACHFHLLKSTRYPNLLNLLSLYIDNNERMQTGVSTTFENARDKATQIQYILLTFQLGCPVVLSPALWLKPVFQNKVPRRRLNVFVQCFPLNACALGIKATGAAWDWCSNSRWQ